MRKSKKFSPEVQERAVRLVLEHQNEHGSQWAAIGSIAGKIGCTSETLRRWVRQAERDQGKRPGPTTSETERIKALERATDALAPVSAVIVLASTAAVIEAASMIPYLAAIGLLTASELSLAGRGAMLFGYCLVMIAPALLLLAARLSLHDHVAPTLTRLEAFLSRNANEAMAWVIFFVGLYMAGDGLNALGWY